MKNLKKHKTERRCKGLTFGAQFIAMLFCQLGGAHGLREICGGLEASKAHLIILEVANAPKRSSFSYTNAQRPAGLFQ